MLNLTGHNASFNQRIFPSPEWRHSLKRDIFQKLVSLTQRVPVKRHPFSYRCTTVPRTVYHGIPPKCIPLVVLARITHNINYLYELGNSVCRNFWPSLRQMSSPCPAQIYGRWIFFCTEFFFSHQIISQIPFNPSPRRTKQNYRHYYLGLRLPLQVLIQVITNICTRVILQPKYLCAYGI